jgi:KDO2-lipid IV(A) lauroyltransferase
MADSRKIKNDIIYALIKGLVFIIEKMPRDLALKLAGVIGEMAAMLDVKERRLAEENLRRAYGDSWNELKIKLVARDCFAKMALNAADVIQSRNWKAEDLRGLVDVEGMEHFDEALSWGKGLVAVTGHIGNFELMAAWFAAVKGISLSVIGRRLYDDRLDALVVENRERFGMENIPSDAPAKKVLSTLKSGRVLGVLIDLDSSRIAGEFIPFFGIPARTPSGPIAIGRQSRSPAVPLAMFRTPDDRYLIRILPIIEIPRTADRDVDVTETLKRCNRALEQLIDYDPTQWPWIHNRWKSKPADDESVGKGEAEEVGYR